MGKPTRWVTDTNPGHSQWYVDRFRQLAAEGADLAGEARLLDALVPPGARVLDAGCGTGRVAAALAARGHTAVGVDADPTLVEAARADHQGPRFLVADLAELDLAAQGEAEPFDAAVLAGNVMVFVAPGTERDVLARVAAHVRPDGLVVVGFATDRGYPVAELDADAVAAGLRPEHRFATWDLRPWRDDADFAVTVLRRPAD
ncbi:MULTISPECIES: class I SAM-dependent methyltransferase [unclassified Micromonospora]|uniref:class I SAM-dependent methyltransferase n=1 Tax=unclassified Micromonospora TaxID=2617518 RepID=UPI0018909331|nr:MULTISPECIES: class I SAM-dependent methyltransferase [unclassified Micromonospora]MBF5031953.1 class I SAM-dependent methyltransferase [Micromonospora sp. ANENR4]MCZ7475082.1 class I SAM-dependent methyltransferase [Micromonospora sp. WMMC273]WBC05702.1 class I SAM-dependent methyltransferase [Micromonospora sp. WMMA1976]